MLAHVSHSCRRFLVVVVLVHGVADGLYAQQNSSVSREVQLLIQQAQSLLGSQQFGAAEKKLEMATQKAPNHLGAWYFLGYSLHAQKKYSEALRAYERANSIGKGTRPNVLYNIACVRASLGESEAAFRALDSAVAAGFANFAQLQSDTELAALRGDPRFEKYKPVWLADDALFLEPSKIIHQWFGESAGDQFGWTARRAGDLDHDGVEDFIATAPTHNNGAGKIYAYSSRSGKLLFGISGKPGFRLGNSAVGIGDVNGDDIPDVLAGAPNANNMGIAFVYSGRDGKQIFEIRGTTTGGQFGYEVSELPDLNGDGIADFLVGAMSGDGDEQKSGRVFVYSGKDAAPLMQLAGEKSGDGFGNAAAATRVDASSCLLAIGAQNAGPNHRGKVYVYEIRDSIPNLKFTIEGDEQSVNLGQMFISFPGDVDKDGVPDVYASDFSDSTLAPGAGKVVIHSGADGKELLSIAGSVRGEGLGTSPSDAGDVDHDGIGDLVIGAWQNSEGAQSAGKIYLYSTAGSGKLLRTWTCKQAGDTLGFDACGIGDVNGDGATDFLVTSAWCGKNGDKSGRVLILAGQPSYELAPSDDSDQ